MPLSSIEKLQFDNTFSALGEEFYSQVSPTPFDDWQLAHFNEQIAEQLGLDPKQQSRPELTQYLTGQKSWPGSSPLAALYAGHQFGMWVPQLGDGRAILLGQTQNELGERWDIQIKGGGPTPYSRHADGRAVLRSTIREYLCSKAMHGLGIPTTHALAMFRSDSLVLRERPERAALLVRIAQSHIRFGSFEVFASRQQYDLVQQLADHVIELFYPEAKSAENPYQELYQSVVDSTADLLAQWQAVGFAHGVMNTDNMSILGLTIDYGPFGFMEAYNPDFICNHSDHQGRYAFARQPDIAMWNLACLGNTLLKLIPLEKAQTILESFELRYETAWRNAMRAKLGITLAQKDDPDLIADLLELMAQNRVDYTILFRTLSHLDLEEQQTIDAVRDLFLNRDKFDRWWKRYRYRLERQELSTEQRQASMLSTNPKYILRNYLAQNAIESAEKGGFTEVDRLFHIVQNPFDEQPEFEKYANHPPDWASGLSVSCSS